MRRTALMAALLPRGDRVLVFGVCVGEEGAAPDCSLGGNPLPCRVVLGTEGFLQECGFTAALPTTLLVAPDGEIHSRHTGARPREVFERDLRELPAT